jgi:hypothetical protein
MLPRAVFVAGLLTALAACEPSIDEVAKQNGCDGLRRDLHRMFVVAGWWNEGQRDIAAYEKKYGKSPLYRIVEERRYGGYGQYNQKYNLAAVVFFGSLGSRDIDRGEQLAELIEKEFSKDFYQAKIFRKCTQYLNQMFEEPGYLDRLGEYYDNPTRYDRYEE